MEQTAVVKKLKNPPVDYVCYFLCKFFFSILTCTELYYFSAFLTDTALFSLGIIGMIQMTTTIIDMIFSFFYGALMEGIGKHMPWGMTRSWLVVAPPVATILFIFCFVRVSENELASAIVIIIAFLASHVVWSIGECAMNAQTVNMTDDNAQRAQMSINLGRGTMASSCVFGVIAGFFLSTFASSPFKYVYMIIVFGILYWIGFLLTFWRSKGTEPTRAEYEALREREKKVAEISSRTATLGQAYKAVFTSKNGIMVMIAILFGYLFTFLQSGLMFYYFNYTIHAGEIMGTFMSVKGIVALIGGVFWVPILLTKICKGSKKVCFLVSNTIMFVGLLLPWLPPFRQNMMFYLVVSMIVTLLGNGGTMMQVGLMADVGAELTYKHKKNLGAFTVSFMALPLKISLLMRSALITAAIGMTGYTEWLAAGQPEVNAQAVSNGFATSFLLWSAVIALIAAFFVLLYNIPEKKAQEYIAENAREAAEEEARVNAILAERGEA